MNEGFQFLEEPRPPRRIGALIHRHQRVITFIGALIVFATFVIKDGLREELKDVVASTEEADATYTLRLDINSLRQQMLAMNVPLLEHAVRSNEPSTPNTDDWVLLAEFQDHCEIFRTSIDNARRIMEKLPTGFSSIHQGSAKHLDEEVRQFCTDVMDWAEKIPMFAKSKEPIKDISKMGDLSQNEIELRLNINSFMTAVQASADKFRDKEERRYQSFNVASYFLYTLGWGLGLVGRLVGVEAGGDE